MSKHQRENFYAPHGTAYKTSFQTATTELHCYADVFLPSLSPLRSRRYINEFFYQPVAGDRRLFLPAITWNMANVPLEPLFIASLYTRGQVFSPIHRSIALSLNCVWTTRNKHHFDNRPPFDTDKSIYQVYSTFICPVCSLLHSCSARVR